MAKPKETPRPRSAEPVWLVRAILVVLLVGLAAYFARQAFLFLS